MKIDRRRLCTVLATLPLHAASSAAWAQTADVWSAQQTYRALLEDSVRLLDIRSRDEWSETGVARGAWLVSMHERRFAERLFSARELADGRAVALICAVGGRTGSVMQALRNAEYAGFVDVSEGMFGSSAGRGWIAEGLPIVTIDEALANTPQTLL